MVRIDAIGLATEPMDMRAGNETALARVVAVFGGAQSHGLSCLPTACIKDNSSGLVSRHGFQMELGDEKLHVLVLGLPWQRVEPGSLISII